jgi:hypothetical protein
VSIEVVFRLIVASDFTHESSHAIRAWSYARDAGTAPFLEDVLFRVAHQPDFSAVLLKSEMIAGFDSKGFADLNGS